jgi:hypothetical protein
MTKEAAIQLALRKKAYNMTPPISMGTGNTSAGPQQIQGQNQVAPTDYTTVPEIPAPPTPITTVTQQGQSGGTPGMTPPPSSSTGNTFNDYTEVNDLKEGKLNVETPAVPKTQITPQTQAVASKPAVYDNGAMKKNAEEYVDAQLRKRAQDGGMLQATREPLTNYSKSLTASKGVPRSQRNYYNQITQMRNQINRAPMPVSPTQPPAWFRNAKNKNLPLTPKPSAAVQPAKASPTPSLDKRTYKPLPGKRPSTPLSTTTTGSTPLRQKGDVNYNERIKNTTGSINMGNLKADLSAMNRPAYTPQRPLSDYGKMSVRKGVAPKPAPVTAKATGGIDPATYKGELQDVVYGDHHYRLPRYRGKTRDFLKANPLWRKPSGEGDKAMGLVKNYKPGVKKTAEEYVDAQLSKRAACGKSHTSKGKKRNKYAKQYKKNIKKTASESPESPDNPFLLIDNAVDMMVKEAQENFELSGDFVYPEKANKELLKIQQSQPEYAGPTNPLIKPMQDQVARSQEEFKDVPGQLREMDKNLAAVKEDSAAIRQQVKKFLKTTDAAKKAMVDEDVIASAIPSPVAGAVAGGGTGLLVTRLLSDNPTLTKYLTGAGIGTGLGIISSLAAKKYARDLASNINKSMADSAEGKGAA